MMALETQEALLCVTRGAERTSSSPRAEERAGLVQECCEKGNDVLTHLQMGRGEEDPKHVQRAERNCCR